MLVKVRELSLILAKTAKAKVRLQLQVECVERAVALGGFTPYGRGRNL
jgi:hypothetical protein